jgi:hypothetical protein
MIALRNRANVSPSGNEGIHEIAPITLARFARREGHDLLDQSSFTRITSSSLSIFPGEALLFLPDVEPN